jgi:hypothetical protein
METQGTTFFAGFGLFLLFILALSVFYIFCTWKLYQKAGRKGWECIIPVYNIIIFLDIIKRPRWWILLYLIPFVSLVAAIINCFDMAKAFGKDTGFGIGLLLLSPVFLPLLALGDSGYIYNEENDLINELQQFN